MKRCFFIIMLPVLCFAISCGDKGCEEQTYSLSENDKASVPYTGDETITFINEFSDTAVLIGQGRNVFYKEEWLNLEQCDWKFNLENDETSFQCTIPKISINLRVYYDTQEMKSFYIDINEYSQFIGILSSSADIDTMTVNNKLYNNIYHKLNSQYYYTKADGLIKFKRDSTDTWSLIPN